MSLPAELTLPNLPALLPRADVLSGAGTLDLSGVERADSAGIAFLLELSRRARRRQKTLTFTGASAQVRALAEFFELESALTFAA